MPDVEIPIGMRLLEHVGGCTVRHGRRNRHHTRVGIGQFDESFPEDLLVAGHPRGLLGPLAR